MSAYLDTSVLGAYYCPEPLSSAIDEVLRKFEAPIISMLSEVEFCSLIAKKQRNRELNERQAHEVLELFANHVAEGFYRRVAMTHEHFSRARQLLTSRGVILYTLDALHLAVALAESVPLVTADKQLASAARRHKCKTVLLQ